MSQIRKQKTATKVEDNGQGEPNADSNNHSPIPEANLPQNPVSLSTIPFEEQLQAFPFGNSDFRSLVPSNPSANGAPPLPFYWLPNHIPPPVNPFPRLDDMRMNPFRQATGPPSILGRNRQFQEPGPIFGNEVNPAPLPARRRRLSRPAEEQTPIEPERPVKNRCTPLLQ
jgi:hypothetical protein